MKQLDEVIKANECCNHGDLDSRCEDCPYSGIGACYAERETDALHYLREYRGDTDNFDYYIEISYPNGDLQRLRYPSIMVDRINCENGISLVMESLGFTNKVNPEGQVGWVKNGAIFASWEKVRIKDFNPPLTWDELRTMVGKSVWVEVLSDEIDLSSRWMLVARETKAHSLPLAYTDDIGHWIFGHRDKLGKTWQAYRKERK